MSGVGAGLTPRDAMLVAPARSLHQVAVVAVLINANKCAALARVIRGGCFPTVPSTGWVLTQRMRRGAGAGVGHTESWRGWPDITHPAGSCTTRIGLGSPKLPLLKAAAAFGVVVVGVPEGLWWPPCASRKKNAGKIQAQSCSSTFQELLWGQRSSNVTSMAAEQPFPSDTAQP